MGATKSAQYTNEIKLIARINRALSHPARLTIVQALNECPGLRPIDLQYLVQLAHSTTLEHLERLKNVDIIRYEYVHHHYQVYLNKNQFVETMMFLHQIEG